MVIRQTGPERVMNMRKRSRTYSPEFKIELMRQWEAGERSCLQLVREHGIAQSVLYRWRDAYRLHGDDAFHELALSEVEALRRRVAQLEQALGNATLENQVLKKGLQLARSRNGTR
jgi:putative transposase